MTLETPKDRGWWGGGAWERRPEAVLWASLSSVTLSKPHHFFEGYLSVRPSVYLNSFG